MRDEHFYTRAIKLNPEKAVEYYIGRAEFYCLEHEYNKAYKDFTSAIKLGTDVTNNQKYKICQDFIKADKEIEILTEKIKNSPDNFELYNERAKFYLLQGKYANCISDINKSIEINPCSYTYEFMDDMLKKIREQKVFNIVRNAKKKDLINAYKLRIKLAQENIALNNYVDYWRKRAELDLDSIVELSKDKALALYLKVNFYEKLKDIRQYKTDNRYAYIAISSCKKVIEESKKRTDRLGKTLTYLYEIKLISLYSWEEDFSKAIKIAVAHPDKPTSNELKKGLKYINEFAFMRVDVLRDNIRTKLKNKD